MTQVRRPVLALAGTRATAARAVPLLRVLGIDVEVVSWQRLGHLPDHPPPDAVLATSVAALDGLPDVPTAVWVDRPDDLRAAHRADVELVLTARAELVDHGAVPVPPVGVDVGRWPPLAPLLRARWRARHGLPDPLVVAVDPSAPFDDLAATLALAGAAVVTGPAVALALALGTPVVTSPETARRIGLRPGVDVEVATGPEAADALARAIAADDHRAAVLSRRGRRFAENHLDLGHPAAIVRRRLALTAPPTALPADRVAARLDELATAGSSLVRSRAADAIALFDPPPGAVIL